MANLTFTKTVDGWKSTAETVSNDFNAHVEANEGGSVAVYIKTAGNGYTKAANFQLTPDPTQAGRFVGEADCSAIVYDKSVIVISSVNPTSGVLTIKED